VNLGSLFSISKHTSLEIAEFGVRKLKVFLDALMAQQDCAIVPCVVDQCTYFQSGCETELSVAFCYLYLLESLRSMANLRWLKCIARQHPGF